MKYRVLKDYIGQRGSLFNTGTVFIKDQPMDYDTAAFYKGLLDYGFIEEIKDEPWKPKEQETYWQILSNGSINNDFYSSKCTEDERKLDLGNCFQTREQAKKAVKWIKAFKVLRDDTHGFKPDWKDGSRKYCVFWNGASQRLVVDSHIDWVYCLIYFATEAEAEESIKNHEKEWLIFLGIEEEE